MMLSDIQMQLTGSVMRSCGADEKQILICDLSIPDGTSLRLFLTECDFRNVAFQADITEVKKHIFYNKPQLIISGNHLWEDKTGILFIIEMRLPKNTQIIIWSDNVNNELLSLQARYNNLHFVKKTNAEKQLIALLRK